jgi:hypothetical protein
VVIDGIGQKNDFCEGRDGCVRIEAKAEGIVATFERVIGEKREQRRVVVRNGVADLGWEDVPQPVRGQKAEHVPAPKPTHKPVKAPKKGGGRGK